jgi:hypothetical protein
MPKLREYIQDLGQDIVLNKSKNIDPVPSPGAESSLRQPVKLKHDAAPGQQSRQVSYLFSHQIALNISSIPL